MAPQVHTPRAALSDADEARAVSIGNGFPGREKETASYARKLIKIKRGLRKTGAPLGKLAKSEAEAVVAAVETLGI